MLKRDRFFAVSARDGSIRPGEFAGDGVWDGDTRILWRLRVLVDGLEPRAVGLQVDDRAATFEHEAGALHVTRVRFIDGGLHERITLANHGDAPVDAVLEIEVAADFAAMLGVRGAVPSLADPTDAEAVKTVDGVRLVAANGVASRVIAFPEGLKLQIRVAPGNDFALRVDVVPDDGHPVIDFGVGAEEARAVFPRWAEECMSVETDNPAVNELLAQATADIRMLCNRYDTGIYPTAGLPWFAVPFGRDALITSILLLHFNPDLARGVLRYLAKHQRSEEHTSE